MDHQLQIRHEPKDGKHSFRIVRSSDGKHTEPVALDVEGQTQFPTTWLARVISISHHESHT